MTRRSARGSSSAAHTRGCSSPAWPTTRSPHEQLGAAARVPGRLLARAHGQLDARGGGDAAGPPRRRPPRSPAAPAPTSRAARGSPAAPRRRATAAPAPRPAARPASSSSGRRSTPGSGAGVRTPPGKTAPCSNSARSRCPRERLRASVASRPGSSVVRSAGSSSDSGLRTTTTVAARVVVRQAERVERRRPDERVGRRLDVPGLGQRAADAAAAALHVGQPAAGRRGRQHRGDVVVAGEPDDLLDQVGRVGQVGAPRRRGDGERAAVACRRRSRPASRHSTTCAAV